MSLILQLEAANGAQLSFTSTVPASLKKTVYPAAEIAFASGTWGHILLQEVVINGFTIARYSFIIHHKLRLSATFHTSLAILQFIINGAKDKEDTGIQFPLPEHTCGLLDAPENQSFEFTLLSGPFLWYHIFFTKSLLQKFGYKSQSSITQTQQPNAGHIVSIQMDRRTYNLMHQLNEQLLRSPYNAYFLNGKCLYIILKFVTDISKSEQYKSWLAKKGNQVIDAVQHLELLFRQGQLHSLTINSFARKLSVSDYQLKRITRELYHLTPMGLIQKVRMEKAMHLLKEKKHSIHQIAQQLGYKDQSSFTRVFKAYYGYPPSSVVKD